MKIRWKLLIVMLSISLGPMILMRGYAQKSLQMLGDTLSARIGDVLIQRATAELSILVEEHARIMQLERALIEKALIMQAAEIEKRLFNIQYTAFDFVNSLSTGSSPSATVKPSHPHSESLRAEDGTSIPVSYDDQSFRPARHSSNGDSDYLSKLAFMVPVYRSIAEEYGNYILWQITAFEDGTQMIYPGLQPYPPTYDALEQTWYRQARTDRKIVWTQAVRDPISGIFSFIVSVPLMSIEGRFLGATAVVVPVSLILHQDVHIKYFPENIDYVIVRSEYSKDRGQYAIRIVAREQSAEHRHQHWRANEAEEWIILDEQTANNQLLDDIRKNRNGVLEILQNGKRRVAAYGNIDAFGSALMLIVNKEDILAESRAMGLFIHSLIGHQLAVTSVILMIVFVGVISLTWLLSRSMTRRLLKLVQAAQRIAAGDFHIRADIQSRDEIGKLGSTFDAMIPALEERIKMKKALEVAKEVQQSLLPKSMPHIEGMDIAAVSLYCDETGGDFFDFMDFCCREYPVNGVVVGEVSGHGIPAALLMATIRAFLRSRVMQPGGVAEIMNDVNRLLLKDAGDTLQFATLFYAEIDLKQKQIEWVRAGHDPAFLFDPEIGVFEELWGEGIPLGIEERVVYEANRFSGLKNGQILLMGTDGVWEARNDAGEMYGKDRLKRQVRKNARKAAQTIVDSIVQDLKIFQGKGKQADDITLVVVKFDRIF
ncbi:MAG: SpoIIE family protein phosphatase [Deltaproteobacteria bacterium]